MYSRNEAEGIFVLLLRKEVARRNAMARRFRW